MSSRPPAIAFLEVAHKVKVTKIGFFMFLSNKNYYTAKCIVQLIYSCFFYLHLLIFLYKQLKHIVNKKHMVQCFWRENAVTSFLHSFSYICQQTVKNWVDHLWQGNWRWNSAAELKLYLGCIGSTSNLMQEFYSRKTRTPFISSSRM